MWESCIWGSKGKIKQKTEKTENKNGNEWSELNVLAEKELQWNKAKNVFKTQQKEEDKNQSMFYKKIEKERERERKRKKGGERERIAD